MSSADSVPPSVEVVRNVLQHVRQLGQICHYQPILQQLVQESSSQEKLVMPELVDRIRDDGELIQTLGIEVLEPSASPSEHIYIFNQNLDLPKITAEHYHQLDSYLTVPGRQRTTALLNQMSYFVHDVLYEGRTFSPPDQMVDIVHTGMGGRREFSPTPAPKLELEVAWLTTEESHAARNKLELRLLHLHTWNLNRQRWRNVDLCDDSGPSPKLFNRSHLSLVPLVKVKNLDPKFSLGLLYSREVTLVDNFEPPLQRIYFDVGSPLQFFFNDTDGMYWIDFLRNQIHHRTSSWRFKDGGRLAELVEQEKNQDKYGDPIPFEGRMPVEE